MFKYFIKGKGKLFVAQYLGKQEVSTRKSYYIAMSLLGPVVNLGDTVGDIIGDTVGTVGESLGDIVLPYLNNPSTIPNNITLSLLSMLLYYQFSLMPNKLPPNAAYKVVTGVQTVYDYIIIGAGTAGSTIAARLSEDPKVQVLLLEAGGDPPLATNVPSLFPVLQHTDIDWSFTVDDGGQNHFVNRVAWARGKVIGGSSILNAMIYVRGFKSDYNNWRDLVNLGWGYDDVLPYFLKSEGNQDQNIVKTYPQYHNTTGPVDITLIGGTKIDDLIIRSYGEMNIPQILDINADKDLGVVAIQGFINDGYRESAARAYLEPAGKRTNLNVVRDALVSRVLLDGNKRAYGVEVYINGIKYKVNARKEVIVSAGSIMTPPILVRSGIGPKEQLDSLGIASVVNLPVGFRLQDHATIPLWISMDSSETNVFNLTAEILKYTTTRTGEFSTIMSIHLLPFISTLGDTDKAELEIYYFWLPKNGLNTGIFLTTLDYKKEYVDQIMAINKEKDIIVMGISILNPKSFGSVITNSTSPFNKPKVVANYLQDEDDVNKAVRGIKQQLRLLDTEAFKTRNAAVIQFNLHDGNVFNPASDDSLKTYAKHSVQTIWHPSGTCRMGNSTDPTSVVDSQLQVRGLKCLRVADASIMPEIISGNLNAPVFMIGEKVSDMIKQNSCSPYP